MVKEFLGTLQCHSCYFCNTVLWSPDHRYTPENYSCSMLHCPITLSKGTVATARANKTSEAKERCFEKLRQLTGNYNMLLLQLLVQWPMVTTGLQNTSSNKFPLCLNMASEQSLWLITIISNTEKGDQSSSALLSWHLVSEQWSTLANLLCRVAKIDTKAFHIYCAQD